MNIKCPVCHSTEDFTNLCPTICSTKNVICHTCGLVFIAIDKDSMQNYYKEGGYFNQSPNLALRKQFISKSLLIKLAKERLEKMQNIYPIELNNLKVLDVGCSYGEILYVLKNDYGCEVVGLEPSKETVSIGQNMFDIDIKPILLEEYESKEKYDLILINHTLEHVDDINKFLHDAKKHLKVNGTIYIEVPNILNPSGGFDLETFLYDEHLQTFSAHNLNLLISTVGLHTYAHSDNGFLEFFANADRDGKQYNVDNITYLDILHFLEKYKNSYNIKNKYTVYLHKISYLSDLIVHKLKDLF